MGIKGKLGIFVLTCVVIVSVGFWYTQNGKNPDREATIDREVKGVVAEVSDKYQVQYTSIRNGGKNPVIKIRVNTKIYG
ncbi:hypothetical protein GCM10007063_27500 [Lentibacillus kapialis]|uniref:Uncharacterized protein n=1 Tax=Lentibacillus kapialis TaxID=340214 RepID=A0A917V091_9BACI|nr:hypothetical protein [Lentibacillus kapialis]GGK03667.1 hypothetical protein GCM10007063_27500 [Lentibacillus kapialis]